MLALASLWIFLLGLRECINIFEISTTLLSVMITAVQFFHLMIVLQQEKYRLTSLHFLLVFFMLLTAYNSNTLPTVNIVLSIMLLEKLPVKKVSLVMTIIFVGILFVYLSAFGLGILQDGTRVYAKGMTHDLGFKNSNTPGLMFFMLVMVLSTCWLQMFKLKFPLLLLLVPSFLIYSLTLGRTSFYLICFYFFLVYYFSFRRNYSVERRLSLFLPVFLFTTTYVLFFIWYKIPFVNTFFSGRFRINGNTFKEMGTLSYLIGYKLAEGPMDSAYLGILLNGGILSVYVFFSAVLKGIRKMPVKQLKIFLPFVLCYIISGFTEGTFSLFRMATVLFYKILIDQYEFPYIQARYLKYNEV